MIIQTKKDEFATSIIEKLSTTSYTSYELYNWAVENIAKKTLVFNNEFDYNFRQKSLKKLAEDFDTFGNIKLPRFRTTYYPKFLTIVLESEFIDGRYITKDDPNTKIIYEELINRKSDWTFSSYSYHNFIINAKNELYYIDIDDYKVVSQEKRLQLFHKFY